MLSSVLKGFYVSINSGGVQELDIPFWNIKLGRNTQVAVCLYGEWCCHVIQKGFLR